MLLLSVLLFFAQGNPLTRTENGTISGMLRTASGTPAVGVRIAAAAANPADATVVNSLVSLTATDNAGHYLLEDVPPGRYYVIAGRIDSATFYPGTLQPTEARAIVMAPGDRIANIDFTIRGESSSRPSDAGGVIFPFAVIPSRVTGLSIPLEIRVEDGGKVPLVEGNFYPVLRLDEFGNGTRDIVFSENSIVVPIPAAAFPTDYRVEVLDLPPGYVVKSITYGTQQNAVDVMKDRLRVAPPPTPAPSATLVSVNGVGLVTSDKTLFVTLARDPKSKSQSPGVRVKGTGLPSDIPIYLSGVPGTIFVDGSFEFGGVPPGRHSLVRYVFPSSMPSLGVSIVVGDRDVDGVKLQSTTILPRDIETDAPRPAGNYAPGATIPFKKIHGKVVQDASGGVIDAGGTVTLTGYLNAQRTYAVDGEGRFEIPSLLPGSYRLQLGVFGYDADAQNIVIDDGDVEITFRGRPVVPPN